MVLLFLGGNSLADRTHARPQGAQGSANSECYPLDRCAIVVLVFVKELQQE